MTSLDDLVAAAAAADEPSIVAESDVKAGGVDPLGLRQLNFDLMDEVLPGLNNVADQLKPFLLMAWAWRRVRLIVDGNGGKSSDEAVRDFVDRIEAVYAWSQFLLDRDSGIPGRQALAAVLSPSTTSFTFGGPDWEKRRKLRRSSTGLISPLNYGPGLRSMGWLLPVGPTGVFRPNPDLDPALDAFEAGMKEELGHDAFNLLGTVEVKTDDVRRWAALWRLGEYQAVERLAGWQRLGGLDANPLRERGLSYIRSVATRTKGTLDPERIRTLLADPRVAAAIGADPEVARTWRRLQVRQLFRLALEAWFYWLVNFLMSGPPMSTKAIAAHFLHKAGVPSTEQDWLGSDRRRNPVLLLGRLSSALADGPESIPASVRAALQCCMLEAPEEPTKLRAPDRLPLRIAASDMNSWGPMSAHESATRIMEKWLLGQHVYWCVGRGLQDARGGGKRILRLRVVLEEGGWTTTRGTRLAGAPLPTADRLETALSLLRDCGQLAPQEE